MSQPSIPDPVADAVPDADDYRDIRVTELAGSFGAEISDVDLAAALPDATIAEIRTAFLAHHVVVLRNQQLDPEALTSIGARFGELEDYPFVAPLPDHPKVIPVIKEADEKVNFGGGWHTDLVYTWQPPLGTMLYAVEVPARGGDTMFASGELAWHGLSARMQALLADLRVEYSVRHVARAVSERSGGGDERSRSMPAASDAAVLNATPAHPLVRTHPETGRRGLYFSRGHTINFEGMTPDESRPLLDWLDRWITQPLFTVRVSWQPGTLTFWDNRVVCHYALNDYHGQRRHMHRLTIAGDTPR